MRHEWLAQLPDLIRGLCSRGGVDGGDASGAAGGAVGNAIGAACRDAASEIAELDSNCEELVSSQRLRDT